jgi:hypothetical protein
MNFNFTYGIGTTLQQMVGMEMAGRIWSSYLKDPITVNIHVGMTSSSLLPKNVIGSALPGIQDNQEFKAVRDRLLIEAGDLNYSTALAGISDNLSFDDKVAVSNIADLKSLNTWLDLKINNGNSSTVKTAEVSTSRLNVTRANAKALGLNIKNSGNLDGYLLFSDLAGAKTSKGQSIAWNYNYTGTPSNGQLDFISTAVHELGHILGFVSGADRPGWMFNQVDSKNEKDFWTNAKGQVKNSTPLDLFRWASTGVNKISSSMIDPQVLNGGRYFSIDNGNTKIADFSTGSDMDRGGDGSQGSHWKHDVGGIMAPKLQVGRLSQVSSVDLRALDAIGWDLQTTTAWSSSPNLTILSGDQNRMLERGWLNATYLANLTIDLSALQSSVISSLATRVGQTESWINSNLTNTLAGLPSSLCRDRTSDVETMITDSVVYNWGRKTGDSAWQTMLNLFHSEGLFSTLDELEFSSNFQTVTLEMSSNLQTGTWTFGLQIGRSDLNGAETRAIDISQEIAIDLGINFENVGIPVIKSLSSSKQSQLGQGSRAWDSKVKGTPEKVIPKIELLEFAHQPQEFAIG